MCEMGPGHLFFACFDMCWLNNRNSMWPACHQCPICCAAFLIIPQVNWFYLSLSFQHPLILPQTHLKQVAFPDELRKILPPTHPELRWVSRPPSAWPAPNSSGSFSEKRALCKTPSGRWTQVNHRDIRKHGKTKQSLWGLHDWGELPPTVRLIASTKHPASKTVVFRLESTFDRHQPKWRQVHEKRLYHWRCYWWKIYRLHVGVSHKMTNK